jgi:hypothetical protein
LQHGPGQAHRAVASIIVPLSDQRWLILNRCLARQSANELVLI